MSTCGLLVVLLACSGVSETVTTTTSAPTSTTAATTSTALTATTTRPVATTRAVATTRPVTNAPASADPPVLEGNGLGVVQFGASEQQVTQILGPFYGSPAAFEDVPPDHCENGAYTRAIRWGALSVFLDRNGKFVAYRVIDGSNAPGLPSPSDLRTSKGVGVGSTIDEVRAAYGANLTDEPSIGAGFGVPAGRGTVRLYYSDVILPPNPDGTPRVMGAYLAEAGARCFTP